MGELLYQYPTKAIVNCVEREAPHQPPINVGPQVVIHQIEDTPEGPRMHTPAKGMVAACRASAIDLCDRACHGTATVIQVEKGTRYGRAGVVTIRPDEIRRPDEYPEVGSRIVKVGNQYKLDL